MAAIVTAIPPTAAHAQTGSGQRWAAIGNAIGDFHVTVDSTEAHRGRVSLRVSSNIDPTGFAGVTTSLAAERYAGHHIEVSAAVRTRSLGGQGATIWVRADSGTKNVAFATTGGRRYLGGDMDWTLVTVALDIPPGASSLAIGALSLGRGNLWIDDVRLTLISDGENRQAAQPGPPIDTEVVRQLGFDPPDVLVPREATTGSTAGGGQLAASPLEPAHALSTLGLNNLVVFARLVGYVRFWYPGTAALKTNWDQFTVRGIRVVEHAPSTDSLVVALRALFADVAPAVAIYQHRGAALQPQLTRRVGTRSIVFWEHCGFGTPNPRPGMAQIGIYHSTRRRVQAPGGRPPTAVTVTDCGPLRTMPVPHPDSPFVADLGAGVSTSVPLALPEGQLPDSLAADAADSTWRPGPATERFSLDDRATRLADVALLWMVPQHFSPDFDVAHTDWSAALRVALRQAARDSDAATFDGTLQRLAAALHDGHADAVRTAIVTGAPDVLLGWVEGRVIVVAIGDSARAHGVRVGDELVAVNGRQSIDALRDAESRTSGATPQWIRHVGLGKLLTGTPNTTVVLRLRDPLAEHAPSREVHLTRRVQGTPAEERPESIAELQPNVFYIDLSRVTDSAIAQTMPRLASARGIIFDVRDYPNRVNTPALLTHLSDSTLRARFELPLILRPDHTQMRFADVGWVLAPQRPRLRARLVFLTGAGTISQAEGFLGVVAAYHLGAIVGGPTAGTDGDINSFMLPGGYRVTWTGMRWLRHDGTSLQGIGIHPTIPVAPTLQGAREGNDEVLSRALTLLRGP